MTDPQNPALPVTAAQSWRLWLLTGARRGRVDRRRLRGSHLGLKRLLVEDMAVRGEPPYGWKEFSDAMVRHAIGDAVRLLPEPDGQVLKLAYFGGCSNRQIAGQFGMTESAVAARLRRALDTVSDRIQRSGTKVKRAAYVVAAWFCGRWVESLVHNAAQVTAVAAAAVVVATGGVSTATLPGRQQPPAQAQPAQAGSAAAAVAPGQAPVAAAPALPTQASPEVAPEVPLAEAPVAIPAVAPVTVTQLVPPPPHLAPVPVPVPVAVPPPPPLPRI
ncbi:MAG TPA: sigma-70 region 4 domain-containing protein [Candidatus Udaeobacter sp.]|nr:sigma-70 region 4 domain-containing protein [Candidatus Udaeobacter sp.]